MFECGPTAEPVTTPFIESLEHDCDTGIFTIVGEDLLAVGGTLSSVTRDDVPVGFTVLTHTNTQITFELTEAFVDGTYCVVVSNDDGQSTDPFCEDFECPIIGCLVLTDDPIPVPTPTVCLPIIDGDWEIMGVQTNPSGVTPNTAIGTADGNAIIAFVPVE